MLLGCGAQGWQDGVLFEVGVICGYKKFNYRDIAPDRARYLVFLPVEFSCNTGLVDVAYVAQRAGGCHYKQHEMNFPTKALLVVLTVGLALA